MHDKIRQENIRHPREENTNPGGYEENGEEQDRSKLLHSVSKDNGSSWKEFAKGRSQWNKLLRTKMQSTKFLVRSVLDVLPTPAKLVTWIKHKDTYCCLFGKPAILDHPYLMIILKSTNQWQVPLQS